MARLVATAAGVLMTSIGIALLPRQDALLGYVVVIGMIGGGACFLVGVTGWYGERQRLLRIAGLTLFTASTLPTSLAVLLPAEAILAITCLGIRIRPPSTPDA